MFLACAQTRFSQMIKIDNITPAAQRHPSADPDVPQIPQFPCLVQFYIHSFVWRSVLSPVYVCEKKSNINFIELQGIRASKALSLSAGPMKHWTAVLHSFLNNGSTSSARLVAMR
jgi:hypothetical protein